VWASPVQERLTGGAGRQRGLGVSGGVQERVREKGTAWQRALTSGPDSTVTVGSFLNSGLNRFKHIQTVLMKFEFLQIFACSKDTFPHSKNLK
jgi:hypothetical protein